MIVACFLIVVCLVIAVPASRAGGWDWEEHRTWPTWAKVVLFPLAVAIFLAGADGPPGPGTPYYEQRRDKERAVLDGKAHISTLTVDHQVALCRKYGWPVPPDAAGWDKIRRDHGTKAANDWLRARNAAQKAGGTTP